MPPILIERHDPRHGEYDARDEFCKSLVCMLAMLNLGARLAPRPRSIGLRLNPIPIRMSSHLARRIEGRDLAKLCSYLRYVHGSAICPVRSNINN